VSEYLWKVICLALTLRSFTSTLLPHKTIGIFSHTRVRSRCQLGTDKKSKISKINKLVSE